MERLAGLADEPVDVGAQAVGLPRRIVSAGGSLIFKETWPRCSPYRSSVRNSAARTASAIVA
jgi:hypothetical protein